nr:RNA-directed DNA polymerase, eukaryota [Tanacetum cinerariifolium]
QVSRKRILWDYVSTLIDRWNGEVVVLGDFNEVRNIDERRGSCFNPTSARVFDQFISASGLVDVKIEGYTFTWSHPSVSKMSKLDRFLVSEDGTWCTNPNKVKEAFFKHFKARFKKPVNHRLKINFLFTKRLSDVQASDLERRVSRDEIRLAVWNCGENKSPGPDGYSSFPNGCNSSFVALISKITDAKFVNEFRPISLIGSVYKVVTKVLANRLPLVISDLISDTQSAFVANRQILDGPVILNELLHWCKRKKKQVMFFKVDFAKAYDSVRWDYLLDVLEAFGKKWGEALDIEDNVDSSFGCKRLCIKTKLPLSILESFKVIFKSKVYMVRAKELFTWSHIFLGQKEMEYTSDEDSDVGPQKVPDRSQFCEEGPNDDRVSDVEEVSETNFGDNSSIPINHIDESKKQQSEDPFKIYRLLRKQPGDDSHEVSSSLSHPPGFTPDVSEASCDNVDPNVIKKGGSVLGVMEDMIRVGKAMGYSMDGCVKNLEQIIGTQGVGDVPR